MSYFINQETWNKKIFFLKKHTQHWFDIVIIDRIS